MGKHKPRLWPPVPVVGSALEKGMASERGFTLEEGVVPGRELSTEEEGTRGSGPLFDNHTHLPLLPGEFISDSSGKRLSAEEQISRAALAGVERIVVSQCSLPEVQTLSEQRERFSGAAFATVYFAVAIHPNDAPRHLGILETGPDGVAQTRESWQETPLEEAIAAVESAARQSAARGSGKVVAIGETGLDYFRTAEAGKDAQKQAFEAHVELAKMLDLPLQIHDREAHADCVALLKRVGAPRRTVFHCFSGDAELAGILAENGWYASFAGNVTYPANTDIQAGVLEMPAELRLIETDAPYLTPAPYRGRPNASYLIGYTADFLADLVGIEPDELRAQTFANAREVYGI
ncbi:TatD family hydrolase [Mobiluncus porci]|uniref:TatD family deoxyribonuclease n=1 Tax=Mobiluncus porci TaxID=2652278 RepID=A0A7K0K4L5_9ACTO|nr:TatD family hydrolase [Mobiluncus porci]MST50389.1 TatD family deoxyribonuclease [Mobiluncus porci]